MACGIARMHSRMVDYTCRRLGGSVCFIYTCPCCNKEYCNLRCLSADKCEGSPGLAAWFLNGKMQWQLECRGRKWLRCDYCCALYLWGRGKKGEHTKDKCVKWKVENAAANDARTKDKCAKWKVENAAANDVALAMNVLSSGINSLSIEGSFVTGSLGPFGSGGEAVVSGAAESGGNTLEIHLFGDQTSIRHRNISKLLGAGYLRCDGMDPGMQKSIAEQVWESLDDGLRAEMLTKLNRLHADKLNRKRDLPIPASAAVHSKRRLPSQVEPADAETAIASLFA